MTALIIFISTLMAIIALGSVYVYHLRSKVRKLQADVDRLVLDISDSKQ
jgi:hypothetical protein